MIVENKNIRTINQLKDSELLYNKKLPLFGYMIIIIVSLLLVSVVIWSINTSKVYIVKSSGKVQSTNKNYIMSPYTGEIFDVNIEEGKYVEEGDILFKVKSVDLNLQEEQLESQKKIYETQISQYKKLVKSIKDDKNYFDPSSSEDNLYYSQYEAYKSQVAQQEVDVSAYKTYGYTDEQIENELVKNKSKVTEVYHSAIKTAEDAILQAQGQLDSINAQLGAVGTGQSEYIVKANTTGKVHMITEYKEGMVVQSAAAIASIASELDDYTVEAYVSISDIARINNGDKVDMAIAGLSQTVYGTISGKVINIDSDMTTSQSSEGEESSSYFKVVIKPDSKYLLSKDGDKINISNGMAVETRIQYDKVTYFEYVLDALGVITK